MSPRVKKSLAMICCACLLLVVGCSSPVSPPTAVSETTSASAATTPTATKAAQPEPTPTKQPEPRRVGANVAYSPESPLPRLDVYLPATGDGPFPTILAIHGGGFYTGDKSGYSRLAAHFANLGYAFVPINYRLAPTYTYPAQVEDVFCALSWVHANHSTYDLDNEHVFVMGESAGGYLAAMLGTVDTPGDYLQNCPNALPQSDWIQGVVVFYGFYDFTSIDGYPPGDRDKLERYWGAEFSEIAPATLAEMSPVSWVDGNEPPFLLIHGTLDTSVPSWMSEDFAAALEGVGVQTQLLILGGADHAFTLGLWSSPHNTQSREAMEAFLSALSEQ